MGCWRFEVSAALSLIVVVVALVPPATGKIFFIHTCIRNSYSINLSYLHAPAPWYKSFFVSLLKHGGF